jgi:hypothetical protein
MPDFSETETFHVIAQWWEAHGQTLYPILAVASLVVLFAGILQAWRLMGGIDSSEKIELKRTILVVVRRYPEGASTERLAQETGIETGQMAKVLADMQESGWVAARANAKGQTVWVAAGRR